MSTSRARILARIRVANAGRAGDGTAPVPGPRPALADAPMATFIARAHEASATVEELPRRGDLAAAVAAYLAPVGIATVTVADHPLLLELDLPAARRRVVQAGDAAALTVAAAGVAETGSVLLLSGPESPTSLNLLPDHLLVALEARAVVPHLEDAWRLLREVPARPPRCVNLITGPSRTADVEQTIQLGAHGPRRLHILVLPQEGRP